MLLHVLLAVTTAWNTKPILKPFKDLENICICIFYRTFQTTGWATWVQNLQPGCVDFFQLNFHVLLGMFLWIYLNAPGLGSLSETLEVSLSYWISEHDTKSKDNHSLLCWWYWMPVNHFFFFIFVINLVFNTHVYTVNCVICLFIDFQIETWD